jgi:hypothetical protein
LRWPGHIKEARKIVNSHKEDPTAFAAAFESVLKHGDDVVVLTIKGTPPEALQQPSRTYFVVVEGDNNKTAMTKTTAHSCSSVAKAILNDEFKIEYGVKALEELGQDIDFYSFTMNKLKEKNIKIEKE